MLKNMKVATLIGLGFGLVILLLMTISIFSYTSINTAADGFGARCSFDSVPARADLPNPNCRGPAPAATGQRSLLEEWTR